LIRLCLVLVATATAAAGAVLLQLLCRFRRFAHCLPMAQGCKRANARLNVDQGWCWKGLVSLWVGSVPWTGCADLLAGLCCPRATPPRHVITANTSPECAFHPHLARCLHLAILVNVWRCVELHAAGWHMLVERELVVPTQYSCIMHFNNNLR
jgi:hypothetical protein